MAATPHPLDHMHLLSDYPGPNWCPMPFTPSSRQFRSQCASLQEPVATVHSQPQVQVSCTPHSTGDAVHDHGCSETLNGSVWALCSHCRGSVDLGAPSSSHQNGLPWWKCNPKSNNHHKQRPVTRQLTVSACGKANFSLLLTTTEISHNHLRCIPQQLDGIYMEVPLL